jgi:hypothetical protein
MSDPMVHRGINQLPSAERQGASLGAKIHRGVITCRPHRGRTVRARAADRVGDVTSARLTCSVEAVACLAGSENWIGSGGPECPHTDCRA